MTLLPIFNTGKHWIQQLLAHSKVVKLITNLPQRSHKSVFRHWETRWSFYKIIFLIWSGGIKTPPIPKFPFYWVELASTEQQILHPTHLSQLWQRWDAAACGFLFANWISGSGNWSGLINVQRVPKQIPALANVHHSVAHMFSFAWPEVLCADYSWFFEITIKKRYTWRAQQPQQEDFPGLISGDVWWVTRGFLAFP